MELNEILAIAIKAKSSDIHIKAGLPPIVRIDGLALRFRLRNRNELFPIFFPEVWRFRERTR